MPRVLFHVVGLAAVMAAPLAGAQAEQDEIAFMRALFAELQVKSIRKNREYCGYVGYTDDGDLVASKAQRGRADSCAPDWPDDFDPVASYHTHGGYDPDAWSEIPSGDDMEADEADGVDGYIATPGGRMWYVDSSEMIASQICGIGCLPMDGDFEPETDIVVQQSYAYEELIEILE